jgi:hypothetical protein
VGANRVLLDPRVTVSGKTKDKKLSSERKKAILLGVISILVVIALAIWQFNIQRPSFKPASLEKMAFQLPEKPSDAVLLFENLNRDIGRYDEALVTYQKLFERAKNGEWPLLTIRLGHYIHAS